MKAIDVIRRYGAGERNFQGVNLRSQHFNGEDFSGADFGQTDIRGTNFTNVNLRKAKFCGAECGLPKDTMTFRVIFSWLLTGILGLGSSSIAYLILLVFGNLLIFGNSSFDSHIVSLFLSAIVIGLGTLTLLGLGLFVIAGQLVLMETDEDELEEEAEGGFPLVLVILVLMSVLGIGIFRSIFIGLFAIILIGLFAGQQARVLVIAGIFHLVGASIGGLLGAGVLINTGAESIVLTILLLIGFSTALSVLSSFVGVYIAKQALTGNKRYTWINSFAINFAAKGGTSFYGSDLTGANFTSARLKSADLRKALLTDVIWHQATMLDRVRR